MPSDRQPYRPVHTSNLHDWSGYHISRKILPYLKVGNTVRILVGSLHTEQINTMYVTVTKIVDGNKYKGITTDPYYSRDETCGILVLFKNGEECMFTHKHICEIPLTWPQNKNLNKTKHLHSTKHHTSY